jgi:hypothetical protein
MVPDRLKIAQANGAIQPPLRPMVLTAPSWPAAAEAFVDPGCAPRLWGLQLTRSGSHYSLGTQETIEAGVAPDAPGREWFHHDTFCAQVYP